MSSLSEDTYSETESEESILIEVSDENDTEVEKEREKEERRKMDLYKKNVVMCVYSFKLEETSSGEFLYEHPFVGEMKSRKGCRFILVIGFCYLFCVLIVLYCFFSLVLIILAINDVIGLEACLPPVLSLLLLLCCYFFCNCSILVGKLLDRRNFIRMRISSKEKKLFFEKRELVMCIFGCSSVKDKKVLEYDSIVDFFVEKGCMEKLEKKKTLPSIKVKLKNGEEIALSLNNIGQIGKDMNEAVLLSAYEKSLNIISEKLQSIVGLKDPR